MNEDFLVYLWKNRHLPPELVTETGEPLVVLHPGEHNSNSGPDFFNARLRIGTTTWAGNVELHLRASDWYRHGHHADASYDQIILHVVYESDRVIYHPNGEPVETLVVKSQFPSVMYEKYRQMIENKLWIPCEHQLDALAINEFTLWAPALMTDRLKVKTDAIRHLLESCHNDLEEAFYHHMAGCFGFKVNALPFELLAKSLPLKIIRKHCHDIAETEALLFGQAGMLSDTLEEEYPRQLRATYQFLKAKYGLTPISGNLWKFLRLRPTNFPTIRISQFADFLHMTSPSLLMVLNKSKIQEFFEVLDIQASSYWNRHYTFDKPCRERVKRMGGSCVKLLIINGYLPFLFFYYQERKITSVADSILSLFEELDGEQNQDLIHWHSLGLPTANALQTQALIHLKQFFCDKKRCLECRIGGKLIMNENHHT